MVLVIESDQAQCCVDFSKSVPLAVAVPEPTLSSFFLRPWKAALLLLEFLSGNPHVNLASLVGNHLYRIVLTASKLSKFLVVDLINLLVPWTAS